MLIFPNRRGDWPVAPTSISLAYLQCSRGGVTPPLQPTTTHIASNSLRPHGEIVVAPLRVDLECANYAGARFDGPRTTGTGLRTDTTHTRAS